MQQKKARQINRRLNELMQSCPNFSRADCVFTLSRPYYRHILKTRIDMEKYSVIICLFLCFTCPDFAQAQKGPYVNWTYKAEPISEKEALIIITADVQPGWHLYSQHLKDGGPQPTKFTFDSSDSYKLTGTTNEKGRVYRYYDDIYEMEITWYSGKVTYTNKINVTQRVAAIKGRVEYMTCNDHTCVPDKREFTIDVDLSKQNQ